MNAHNWIFRVTEPELVAGWIDGELLAEIPASSACRCVIVALNDNERPRLHQLFGGNLRQALVVVLHQSGQITPLPRALPALDMVLVGWPTDQPVYVLLTGGVVLKRLACWENWRAFRSSGEPPVWSLLFWMFLHALLMTRPRLGRWLRKWVLRR